MRNTGLCWHVHHEVLAEWCWDLEGRRDYIRTHKPEDQRELRLRLLKPISEKVKTPKIRAWETAVLAREEKSRVAFEAVEAREEVRQALREAVSEVMDTAWEAQKELDAAHDQDCPDCPWDGNTIFPEPRKES